MSSNKPNIVFILADDLAIWALGCYGNCEIKTPNIDALAESGVRFSEFYCTSPVCSPARASLMTGKIPSNHGIQDWIRGGNGLTDQPIDYLADHRTYTEILAEHGYHCGISGKWHLGASPRPQKGFEHWFVFPLGGGSYIDAPMCRDGKIVKTTGYLSDIITDDAIEFVRDQASAQSPFYLSLNFTAPHSPWVDQHPQRFVDLYADCAFESCPQEPRHPWVKTHPMEMQNTERNAAPTRKVVTVRDQLQGYFAAVSAMDECVGRLIAALRELGIEHDTIVIFGGDNGFNCGHHGIWGKGNATFPQNMYDTSVKVPMVFSWPGVIPAGGVSDAMLSGYDMMSTILDLVGLGSELPQELPGTSFYSTLMDASIVEAERPVVVFDEYGPARMIRTRDWKYVHRYPYGPHELFDLVNDPGERINLLADERVLRAEGDERHLRAGEMWRQMEHWFDKYVDPRVDGRVHPITGRGQMEPVGRPGVDAFHPLETESDLHRAPGSNK